MFEHLQLARRGDVQCRRVEFGRELAECLRVQQRLSVDTSDSDSGEQHKESLLGCSDRISISVVLAIVVDKRGIVGDFLQRHDAAAICKNNSVSEEYKQSRSEPQRCRFAAAVDELGSQHRAIDRQLQRAQLAEYNLSRISDTCCESTATEPDRFSAAGICC